MVTLDPYSDEMDYRRLQFFDFLNARKNQIQNNPF